MCALIDCQVFPSRRRPWRSCESLTPSHLVIILSLGPGGFLFLFTSLSVALSFSGLTVCLSIFSHQCVPNHTSFPSQDPPTGAEREGSDYLIYHCEKCSFNKTWLTIQQKCKENVEIGATKLEKTEITGYCLPFCQISRQTSTPIMHWAFCTLRPPPPVWYGYAWAESNTTLL